MKIGIDRRKIETLCRTKKKEKKRTLDCNAVTRARACACVCIYVYIYIIIKQRPFFFKNFVNHPL